jgi:hypothetical protein
LEFYSRALRLASDARRIGDGEALRLAEELCRELATGQYLGPPNPSVNTLTLQLERGDFRLPAPA